MVKEGHARARAGAAGRRIDLARAPDEGVRRYAIGAGQLVNEDVVDRRLPEAGHLDLKLRVDGLADGHAALGDAPDHLAIHGEAVVPGLRDGEDVSCTDSDVDWHLARPLECIGDSNAPL